MLATAPDTEQLDDYDPAEKRPVLNLVKHPTRPARQRWELVEDPKLTETGQERHDRFLRDHRQVDMNGAAILIKREYATVKDIRHEDGAQRDILSAARHELDPARARKYAELERRQHEHLTVDMDEYHEVQRQMDEIDDAIIAKFERRRDEKIKQALFRFTTAHDRVLLAFPRERDTQGQTPVWYVSDIVYWRRRRRMNNIWGDKEETRGRPRGSATRAHILPLQKYAKAG